jgi:outer membrane lipoprotein LolB
LTHWELEGRLAIANKKNSWSASIFWEHAPGQDKLKLAGPLGQGAVIVQLSGNKVMIDRGDGNVQWSERPDEFVSKELAIFVPVKSLRYWVIGLPEAFVDFQEIGEGFKQNGCLVEFKQMQSVGGQLMPRKIGVSNDQVKLTLVIDRWNFIDAKTK